MSKTSKKTRTFPAVAMVLAWIIPGAGHIYLGRVTRGLIIFVAISAMFWGGIAFGGVMTVDRQKERWWFVAQMLTGSNGLVGWQRQQAAYSHAREQINLETNGRADSEFNIKTRTELKLIEQKLVLTAPEDNVARAYSGIAGLMNLMCIFDALMLSLMGVKGEPKRAPKDDEGDQGDEQS